MNNTTRIFGVTERSTGTLVVLGSGRKANLRCGADILLIGMYQDVKGEAICPVCGAKTEVVVKGRRVVSVKPGSAQLHYVVDDGSKFSIRCDETFIFDRKECLERWLPSYQGNPGVVSQVPDFMCEAISRRGSLR